MTLGFQTEGSYDDRGTDGGTPASFFPPFSIYTFIYL